MTPERPQHTIYVAMEVRLHQELTLTPEQIQEVVADVLEGHFQPEMSGSIEVELIESAGTFPRPEDQLSQDAYEMTYEAEGPWTVEIRGEGLHPNVTPIQSGYVVDTRGGGETTSFQVMYG